MRLQIDISDVAIEKNEEVHQLHLWGIQTSLWKNNCLVCGKETNAARIRCGCGEGVFCNDACRQQRRALPLTQCDFMNHTSLKDRPSSNHRRIVILQSEKPYLNPVWAEVKDSHLIIDHPVFDDFFGEHKSGSSWLDLAVINPAVDTALFRTIGHGIAMGFSAAMMDPDTAVEAKWRNRAVTDISGPGYKAQWPGPLVFFCYGYGLSDYVKVNQAQSDNEGIYDAMDERATGRMAAKKGGTSRSKTVWKWRVKEHGTSMKVLDLTHRDLGTVLDYISRTQLNPIPHIPNFWNKKHMQAVNARAQFVTDNRPDSALTVQSPKGENISFRLVVIPNLTFPLHPMLGAFAVGLQWMIHYSMDINPPFRGEIPRAERWPIMDMLWAVEIRKSVPEIGLHVPSSSCDSAVIMDTEARPIDPHHARALYKYLRHTDPQQWSRRGPKGFENYWAVYAKVDLGEAKAPDVYPPRRVLDPANELDRIMSHMTLEQLCMADLGRGEEIEKTRRHILNIISWYRNASPGRGFVDAGV
ncbi:hypothetical protein B0I37DRAFT_432976 [Chaetomium sp. MPI-CAGE-AT-0009]|nr:hypothetical protein B0I37DRAFT_432976 [Chaetomium sp. MPI-CAGE-AT-0009]